MDEKRAPEKRGPKPKYKEIKLKLHEIEAMAEQELTDKQIYNKLGVGHTAWYNWIKKHKELAEAVKRGRKKMQGLKIREVEDAQFKLATGHYVKETTTEIKIGKDGKEIKKISETEKYIAPNPLAQKMFLVNRDPERWQDKSKTEITGKIEGETVVDFKEKLIERIAGIVERRRKIETNPEPDTDGSQDPVL